MGHEKTFYIPYARHHKPRLVSFFTQFSLWLRPILQTIYVLKTEILHFLSSKFAAYKRERLQIESGLWWRGYGTCPLISKQTIVQRRLLCLRLHHLQQSRRKQGQGRDPPSQKKRNYFGRNKKNKTLSIKWPSIITYSLPPDYQTFLRLLRFRTNDWGP